MERRQKKQIIFGSIFAGFVLVLAMGVFLMFWSRESCFDGIQNQGEEGIDCGGPCAECVIVGEPLQILWSRAFASGEGVYDIAAKIQNPNLKIGAASFNYELKIYGSGGKIIETLSGESYILPGESHYLILPIVKLAEMPTRVALSLSNVAWAEPKITDASLIVKNKDYEISPAGSIAFSEASGTVVNNSDFDFDRVEIAVVLLDKRGNAVAVNKTEARTVLAKKERFFKVSWPSPFEGEVANYDMRAATNIFSSENILKITE